VKFNPIDRISSCSVGNIITQIIEVHTFIAVVARCCTSFPIRIFDFQHSLLSIHLEEKYSEQILRHTEVFCAPFIVMKEVGVVVPLPAALVATSVTG